MKDWEVKTFLHAGAGANNASSAINTAKIRGRKKVEDRGIKDPELIKEMVNAEVWETVVLEASWWFTWFDDPRDYEAIELGFEYYDKV